MAALSMWLVAGLALFAPLIHARVPPAFQEIQLGENDACGTCKVAVHILSDLLCDAYVDDTAATWVIDNICQKLQDKKQCADIVAGLAPAVVQWIRASADPESMCQSAGVCGKQSMVASFLPKKKVHSPKRNDMSCSLCMFVTTKVKAELSDPTTQQEIHDKSIAACAALPEGVMRDTCTGFVEQYEMTIFEFINTMEPADLCQLMGTCTDMTLANALPAGPLSPAAVAALGPLVALLEKPTAANDKCETCKVVVMEVHQVLANPDIQTQLVDYAKQACNLIQSLSAQCKADVDQYAPMVFGMALAYLQPEQVCSEINLCPPPSLQAVARSTFWMQSMLSGKYGKMLSLDGPMHA